MIYTPTIKATPELVAAIIVVVPIVVCVCAVAVPLLGATAAIKHVRRRLRY